MEIPPMPDVQPSPDEGRGRATKLYVVGACVVAGAVIAAGAFHLSRNASVATAREARGSAVALGPRVEVVAATQGPKERTITLLADVRANQTATLYSKVSGYVKTL